jgi:uncharacterized protein (DUF488 family)
MARASIFTIGHSNHPWEHFIDLLTQHSITAVVDLRSRPGSRFSPHFNKEVLQTALQDRGIRYQHFGDALGARRTEPHLLNSRRQLSWSNVKQDPEFLKSLNRIEAGAEKGYRIALLCAEDLPLKCHRFPMVAQPLAERGFEILHILPDGTLKDQVSIEQELVELYSDEIPQPSIFDQNVTVEQQLESAYELLNRDLGQPPLPKRKPDQPEAW